MPTLVTVGLSRKVSENFQSQSYSLNIQAELPGSATQDAEEMAKATSHLFQLAEDLLTEQIGKGQSGHSPSHAYGQSAPRSATGQAVRGNGNGQAPATGFRSSGAKGYAGNGNGNGNGHGNGAARAGIPGITQAQAKAIDSIAKQMNEDPDRLSQDEFGLNVPDLSIRQASELIDLLKKQIQTSQDRSQASQAQGGRR